MSLSVSICACPVAPADGTGVDLWQISNFPLLDNRKLITILSISFQLMRISHHILVSSIFIAHYIVFFPLQTRSNLIKWFYWLILVFSLNRDSKCKETFEKCSILVKTKEDENFNHRNILNISRIEI